MFVDLRDEVGLVGRLLATQAKGKSFLLDELVVVVGVVEEGGGSMGEILSEIAA
jgi:hypothetical protein